MCGRPDSRAASRKRTTPARSGSEVRSANGRCAGQSASKRGGASGSETGEHHANGGGGETAGFWLGESGRAGGEGRHIDRGGDAKFSGDRAGDDCWDFSIHVAGAD